jgi:glycosyltransferase involved in cell wall biosynthesis
LKVDTTRNEQGKRTLIPRVLIVDLSDNFGGTNARILALMKNFPKEHIGLATVSGSLIASELEEAGYAVHRLAKNKFDPRIPLRMARVIRAHGYQVVDTQNPQSKLWGSMAALLGGASLISTLNSWYMNEHPRFSLRWFGYSAIELLTNIALSRYIVVSREIQDAMLHLGISSSKIDLIYNAINISSFKINGGRAHWIQKYDLPVDAILCVSAGRLSWAKGHDTLIRAIQRLAAEEKRIYCLIAGEGELEQSLRLQIGKAGLKDRVILLGHLSHPDVLSLLTACDIFVMPSRTEGTPIALLEAAGLRKPILASRVGGIPELIRDEEDGLLVPTEQPSALVQGIRRLIQEKGLAERLVDNAYRKVMKDFSLDVQVNSTVQSYNKALQAGKAALS